VELRGWNGIALPAVHSRDAKIYIDDPGPWIMGLATEARYSVRPAPEVCVCDLYVRLAILELITNFLLLGISTICEFVYLLRFHRDADWQRLGIAHPLP